MSQPDFPPPWGGPAPEPPGPVSLKPAGPWGIWATLGFTILMIGALIISEVVAIPLFQVYARFINLPASEYPVGKELFFNGDFLWLSLSLAIFLCGPVIWAALVTRRPYPISSYLALRKVSGWKLLGWIAAFIVFSALLDLVLYLAGVNQIPDWMEAVYRTATCRPGFFIAVGIIAPVIEELIFRGFLFAGVQARLGSLWAVVFATVPWTLLHVGQYEWHYVGIVLGLGLFISAARWRTGSIYVGLALHGLNNIIGLIQVMYFT